MLKHLPCRHGNLPRALVASTVRRRPSNAPVEVGEALLRDRHYMGTDSAATEDQVPHRGRGHAAEGQALVEVQAQVGVEDLERAPHRQ